MITVTLITFDNHIRFIMTNLEDYLKEKRANGVKENSIDTIRWVIESLNKIKPLDECSESDLKDMLGNLKCTEKTASLYKVYVKNYFKWRKEPEKIAWIRCKKIKTHIREDDLLTPDEIKKMLGTSQSPRESALISILSESACRISEALNLNINDLSKTDYGFKMRIRDGKTGARDIALISSVPHIKQWLNIHPLRNDADAPLFVNLGTRNHYERMTRWGARKVIRTIAKNAGIKRRVHPHLFRHTTLTNLASDGMQESILRKLAGWAGSSEMPAVYIHVGNKDVEDAQLARHGKAVAQKHLSDSPLTKECPNCHKEMPIEAQYCDNCSKHQELTPVVKRLLEEHQQVLSAQEDFKRKIESLERSIENMNMFNTLANRSEQSWGFQTSDDAEAWEPGTGNVITFKEVNGKITKSIRKPIPEDYKPDNPLLDPAPVAVTMEDKKRAEEFVAKQKSLVDDLHRRGDLTSSEKAKKLTEQLEKKNKIKQ